jgi:hypothetical protein
MIKCDFTYGIEIPFEYTDKYKRSIRIYCKTNKFKYNNFGGDLAFINKK